MSGVLERILASKRAEVAGGKASPPADDGAPRPSGHRDVVATLRRRPGGPLHLVAEVKFRSPSAGALSGALDAGERAVAYAGAGVAMVSVLCDRPFFGGGWEDLSRARRALDRSFPHVPVLAKEFIVDPVQLDWARAHGADAVLLIVRIATVAGVAALVSAAHARGLEPLVEVFDDTELDAALKSDARLIGVNARDLDTLELHAERAARVLSAVPADRVAVYLSGVRDRADVESIAATRADAALIGETLMRQDDPAPLLRELLAASRSRASAAR